MPPGRAVSRLTPVVPVVAAFLALAGALQAAERHFSFSEARPGPPPPEFRSTAVGSGEPGRWEIVEEVADTLANPAGAAGVVTRRRFLAQTAANATDEHFPLLVFEKERFGDFSLKTRFKLVSGTMEQMAGIVFRMQDEQNFYVIRASGLGRNLRFYKVVDGVRSIPRGPDLPIPAGTWHELQIDCSGNQIRARLNGTEVISVVDNSFLEGRVGFWTKSDSVSWFGDTSLEYVPREPLANQLVRETMEKYPRLIGVKLYGRTARREELHVIASSEAADLGQPAGKYELESMAKDAMFYGKKAGEAFVNAPLHDRNGDVVAVVRIILKALPGQTEQNAIARAKPIVTEMEGRVRTANDLTR